MKSLLSYTELLELREQGVFDAPIENIQGASVDITLDNHILIEDQPKFAQVVNIARGERISTRPHDLAIREYHLQPGEPVLGSSIETLNIPNNIAALLVMKSTLCRNFLDHMLAGFIDPYFSGKLTLELKNESRFHEIILTPGMKIGQLLFFKITPVPDFASYKTRGQYNNQTIVTAAGILR